MEPENLPETHKMQLQLQRWYYDNISSANLGKTRQIFHMYFFHVYNRHLKWQKNGKQRIKLSTRASLARDTL
jgi:hypothetical protein